MSAPVHARDPRLQVRTATGFAAAVPRELDGVGELTSLREQVEPLLHELFQVLGQHRDRSTLVPALEREIVAAGGPQLRG